MPHEATFRPTRAFQREMAIRLRSGEALLAEPRLVEISARRATVALSPEEARRVDREMSAVLEIESPRLGGTMELPCTVSDLHGPSDQRRAVLVFDPSVNLDGRLSRRLMSLFNERRAYRVRPPPDRPVPVTLRVDGLRRALRGELIDISVLGAGVRVPSDAADELRRGSRVALQAPLLDGAAPLVGRAVVRHAMPIAGGEALRVGLEFLLRSLAYPARRVLTRYVMDRQLEARRRLRQEGDPARRVPVAGEDDALEG